MIALRRQSEGLGPSGMILNFAALATARRQTRFGKKIKFFKTGRSGLTIGRRVFDAGTKRRVEVVQVLRSRPSFCGKVLFRFFVLPRIQPKGHGHATVLSGHVRFELQKLPHEIEVGRNHFSAALDVLEGFAQRDFVTGDEVGEADGGGSADSGVAMHENFLARTFCAIYKVKKAFS